LRRGDPDDLVELVSSWWFEGVGQSTHEVVRHPPFAEGEAAAPGVALKADLEGNIEPDGDAMDLDLDPEAAEVRPHLPLEVGRVDDDGSIGFEQTLRAPFDFREDSVAVPRISTAGLEIAAYIVRTHHDRLKTIGVVARPRALSGTRQTAQDKEGGRGATSRHVRITSNVRRRDATCGIGSA
jgi:hypothetical protein